MRALTLAPVILAVTIVLGAGLGAGPAGAGSRVISLDAAGNAPQPTTEADFQKYRGFIYDLSN